MLGDDAAAARWVDADPNAVFYANHRYLIEMTAHLHNAHWTT